MKKIPGQVRPRSSINHGLNQQIIANINPDAGSQSQNTEIKATTTKKRHGK